MNTSIHSQGDKLKRLANITPTENYSISYHGIFAIITHKLDRVPA
jgi:hypothetical protein